MPLRKSVTYSAHRNLLAYFLYFSKAITENLRAVSPRPFFPGADVPWLEPAPQSAVVAASGVAHGRARGNGHASRSEPQKLAPQVVVRDVALK
jgi:hypothetical protein